MDSGALTQRYLSGHSPSEHPNNPPPQALRAFSAAVPCHLHTPPPQLLFIAVEHVSGHVPDALVAVHHCQKLPAMRSAATRPKTKAIAKIQASDFLCITNNSSLYMVHATSSKFVLQLIIVCVCVCVCVNGNRPHHAEE